MGSQALPFRFNTQLRAPILYGVVILTIFLFWPSLKAAIALGLHDDRYLHVIVAPGICALLLFLRRSKVFCVTEYTPGSGIPLLALSVALAVYSVYGNPGAEAADLPLTLLAIVLIWMAAFFLCFGANSFRRAVYPLCCLFLMVPLPFSWIDRAVVFLQHGSAAASYQLLRIAGIPVIRHGTVFSLPGLNFEVAPECSGIHSSLALLMIAIIAAYVCLRSGWGRLALMVLTVPIAIVKNAVRIVVTSVLGAYVDRAYIDGPFHHRYGGPIFSIVGVVLFGVTLAVLQKIEMRSANPMSGKAGDTRPLVS